MFLGGRHIEADYAARREDAFIVAVNCFEPGGTCFCVSMGTGPKAEAGYDLALTEILDGAHRLLVEVGSERGAELLVSCRAGRRSRRTCTRPRRPWRAPPNGWAAPSTPTTFPGCSPARSSTSAGTTSPRAASRAATARWSARPVSAPSVEDATDLTGGEAERARVWDTCFSVDHSYIHGGAVRPSGRSRYRQWLTHKFGTWHEQFGTSGCVGCGRCLTWCPVGIDVTEELAALRLDGESDADG